MKSAPLLTGVILLYSILLFTSAYRPVTPADRAASPTGVHFKIAGKQVDIPHAIGIYVKEKGGVFTVYNAGLPGFPETTISLAVGSKFKGSTGTFKSAADEKGFVFLFTQGNMKNMIGYAGGKDDPDGAFTVASTPISITITSFSAVGTDYVRGHLVSAQGTFSGKVYDFKNKTTVDLTDGTFNVQGSN